MTESLTVCIKGKDHLYDIIFGTGLFPQIAKDAPGFGARHAIITDSNVKDLYGLALRDAFIKEGLEVELFHFPAGESSKGRRYRTILENKLLSRRFGRDSVIYALGGGVVGDLVGEVADGLVRGVRLDQIPTTTISQADSSVGGKVGIDTPYGKNLIGAYKQPDRVCIDIGTLYTLDDRNYKNGLAEILKHGIVADAAFFEYLEDDLDSILKRDADTLLSTMKQSCSIKRGIVEKDPEEKGIRQVLNYGHTVGHALEWLTHYRLLHGEAVSIGMMVMARVSNFMGYMKDNEVEKIENVFLRAGLPTRMPKSITADDIIKASQSDKKTRKGIPRYCILESIGTMLEFGGSYTSQIDESVIRRAIAKTM